MILLRQLPENATYKNRSYDLRVISHPLANFSLTIRQGEPHRKNFDNETYLVQLQPAPRGQSAMLLLKEDPQPTDEYADDVYLCVISPPPSPTEMPGGRCTCKAGQIRKWCKHREALCDAAFNILGLTFGGHHAEDDEARDRRGPGEVDTLGLGEATGVLPVPAEPLPGEGVGAQVA